MSLLGLDVGTTGCKAILFDREGRILGSAYREYPLLQPRPGWIELDPEAVWRAVKECILEVSQGVADRVTALSTSVLGEAVTAIGGDGKPLGNSIVGFDQRGIAEVQWWAEVLGRERIFAITGQPLQQNYTINKIMWWRKHCPEVFHETQRFLCYGDLILMKLGLPPTIDYSMAARTMAFDVHEKRWSPEILSRAQIDERLLPEVQPSGTPVGEIPRPIAQGLGLPPGVVAVVGGHDQPCGALGAGITREGRAMYAIGTVECITLALDRFHHALGAMGFPCYPHTVPELFVTMGYNFTGGSLLRWYRDTFAQDAVAEAQKAGRDAYDLILADLPEGPSPLFVLPHFVGTGTPWLDPSAKGAILGLTLGTRRQDLVKAILEGVTYEMAVNLKYMAQAGVKVEELRAIGGGAKSPAWLALKADILGRSIKSLNVSEAAGLGAALLAGYGTGLYPTLATATEELIAVKETFQPRPEQVEKYRKKLATYERIYPAVKGLGPL